MAGGDADSNSLHGQHKTNYQKIISTY